MCGHTPCLPLTQDPINTQLLGNIMAHAQSRPAVDSLTASSTVPAPLLSPLVATATVSTPTTASHSVVPASAMLPAEGVPPVGSCDGSSSQRLRPLGPKHVIEELSLLEKELTRYVPLGQMLDAISSCSMHPHAVDGQALRLASGQPPPPAGGSKTASASSLVAGGDDVDVAVLLHKWADGLEACLPHFRTLAGRAGPEENRSRPHHPTLSFPGSAAADPSPSDPDPQLHRRGAGGASGGGALHPYAVR